MQSDNGWFQLESHAPVKNNRPNNPGASPNRYGPKPNQQRRQAAANDAADRTYEQKPGYENTYEMPPQNNAYMRMNHGFFAERQTNDMNDGAATPLQDSFKPYVQAVPYAEMNQRCPEAMPAPENMAGKTKDRTLLWDDDRILDTRHSQTVGQRGPVLLQDSALHEALEVFVHTKIPERPVHVKGFGAFGNFRTMNAMREYTKLSFLQSPGQQVPVMVRFSLAAGNKGTPDTSRNVRGFSTKFYTRDGVFDLLCNHIPVLFVRDGMRFPEAFTSLAPSPVNNLIDPERFWRFVASAPEATHFITWLYSHVGIPKDFRHMRGSGVNTYVWRNAQGVRRYVKYHWIPLAGEQYIDRQEGTRLAGIDPDLAGQDLYDTIAAGKPVQYELRVQLMDPQDESILPYDPLDCTKVWDERQYPLIPVGRLTLNRNPDNFTEQIEKAAFSPSNLLDGAELSDDKLLQARANIYWDSQRHRLGENFRSIPVNDQKNWTPDEQISSGTGRYVEGDLVRSSISQPDNFTQAGERYLSLSPEGQDQLVDNLAFDLAAVSAGTRNIVLKYLYTANAELGQRVASQIAVYTKQ